MGGPGWAPAHEECSLLTAQRQRHAFIRDSASFFASTEVRLSDSVVAPGSLYARKVPREFGGLERALLTDSLKNGGRLACG